MSFPWRRLLAVTALAAGFLLVAACGGEEEAAGPESTRDVPMFRVDPAHTGLNPGPGLERSPKLLWRFHAGGCSSPAVVDGVVYIGSADDDVYALDAETGQ